VITTMPGPATGNLRGSTTKGIETKPGTKKDGVKTMGKLRNKTQEPGRERLRAATRQKLLVPEKPNYNVNTNRIPGKNQKTGGGWKLVK